MDDRSRFQGLSSTNILTLQCFVDFLQQIHEPSKTLAVISCCSYQCREAYSEALRHRKEQHVPPEWVAYILWQTGLQPRSGVSVASRLRLEKALTMSVEQLVADYMSQDNFLMFVSDPSRVVYKRDENLRLPSQDMMPILKKFDEAKRLVDPDETDVAALRIQLKTALMLVPPFLLRLLVARDCHLERMIEDRYSDQFCCRSLSEEAVEAFSASC